MFLLTPRKFNIARLERLLCPAMTTALKDKPVYFSPLQRLFAKYKISGPMRARRGGDCFPGGKMGPLLAYGQSDLAQRDQREELLCGTYMTKHDINCISEITFFRNASLLGGT